MKKIIIVILISILLTGCDMTYTLDYNKNIFNEDISILGDSNDDTEFISFYSLIDSYYKSGIYTNYFDNDSGDTSSKSSFYNAILLNDGYGINFNYNFDNDDDYYKSTFFNILSNNGVINKSGIYINSVNDIYVSYPILNDITIKFKTDKIVESNNADKIENNTYFWYINKKNYKNKKISISFEETKKDIYVEDGYLTNNFMKYFFVILSIIILIIILIIYNKVKKSNKKW